MCRLMLAPLCGVALFVAVIRSQEPQPTAAPPFSDAAIKSEATPRPEAAARRRASQQAFLAESFKGVTTNGELQPGLFTIRRTGVSTEPIRQAAVALLQSLRAEQRQRAFFELEDQQWQRWDNVPSPPSPPRTGVSMAEMTDAQRELTNGLIKAGLSAKGFSTAQDIMKLNATLGASLKSDRFGRWLYSIAILGTPSETEPWGWQLNGHHLDINYFILGDQVVMTPTFMGAEPVRALTGEFVGTVVLQSEQDKGERLFFSLTKEEQRIATLSTKKTGPSNVAEAYADNLVLDYAGLRASSMSNAQRNALLDLVGEYVTNMPPGPAALRMDEVTAHLDDTYFAWIGSQVLGGVFYYRIQSPVILIEFDHQGSVRVANTAIRDHIHTVVKTPNGNDYGKDLLRQHYLTHPHPAQRP